MQDKQKERIMHALSDLDDGIVERNGIKRYHLWRKWKMRQKKRMIAVLSSAGTVAVAACILFFALILPTLTPIIAPPAGGKQAPVYEGMTVSHQAPVTEGAYLPLDGITLSNSDRIYTLDNSGNNGNNGNNGNHFGNDKKPIKDAIAESLQIVGSPEGYFAEAGEIIYITVHFDNPDLFEIWSFTLAGQPKQVGMEGFVVGLDLQTVTVPMQVPADAEGVIEYTIDAIKYVDGEEFKDVRMEGDDTVRVTVRPKDQPTASVTGETVGFNDITLNLNLTDPKALIAATEGGKLYALLYDGEEIISKKEITLTDTAVTFDSLATDTVYQYAIVAVYDALDGQGTVAHILAENIFYCEHAYSFVYGEAGEITGIALSEKEYSSGNALRIVFPEKDPDGNLITTISLDLSFLNFPQYLEETAFQKYVVTPLEQLVKEGKLTKEELEEFKSCYGRIDPSQLPSYEQEALYVRYPFMEALPNAKWYSSNFYNNVELLRSLIEEELDFNAAANEVKSMLEAVGAHDAWLECKHYFLTVSKEKQIYFKFSSPIRGLYLNNDFGHLATEVEGGIHYVGNWAVASEPSIVNAVLREDTAGIFQNTFSGCTSLESINIPNSVTSIGDYAFSNCRSLTNITIPDSVTEIGKAAFTGCTSLESINVPDGVTQIYEATFAFCYALTDITVGSGVTRIDSNVFYDSDSLTTVYYRGTPNQWNRIFYIDDATVYYYSATEPTSVGNYWRYVNDVPTVWSEYVSPYKCTVNKGGVSYTVTGYVGEDSELTIPASLNGYAVTAIGSSAFSGCNITSITIPDSVTSIGDSAFENCESLTSITIGNGVTSIGSSAFSGCNITSITIPDSVTSIGSSAFLDCENLTSITIPNSVTSIGFSALSGCSSLSKITLPFVGATKDGTVHTHFGYIFGANYSGSKPNHVPSSLKTVVITGGTSIGEEAFHACESLTSITILDGVTSIDNEAFEFCTNLRSVTIPNSVTSIGDTAFYACGITSITIPDGVTSIGAWTFGSCPLTSITIPDSVTRIGERAFLGCTSLTTVYYTGTAEEWDQISIGISNSKLTAATRYYYSESPVSDGNLYWHYDENGNPVPW